MKLIKLLEEKIEDEIHDIKEYAELAAEVKDEHPSLAQVLYNISVQEDAHHAALHGEVVKLIEEHRRKHGEPPAAMMAVYEYLHNKQIDKVGKVKNYLAMFREQ